MPWPNHFHSRSKIDIPQFRCPHTQCHKERVPFQRIVFHRLLCREESTLPLVFSGGILFCIRRCSHSDCSHCDCSFDNSSCFGCWRCTGSTCFSRWRHTSCFPFDRTCNRKAHPHQSQYMSKPKSQSISKQEPEGKREQLLNHGNETETQRTRQFSNGIKRQYYVRSRFSRTE